MVRKNSPLTSNKLSQVATALVDALKDQLPGGSKAVDELKPKPRLKSERAKQWFHLLRASAAEKAILMAHFFTNLEERLANSASGISYKHFGFDSWKSFAEYVENKVAGISSDAENVAEFTKGMNGRKWWFMGSILFERYIKYGPVRRFLDEAAQDAYDFINAQIKPAAPYTMIDAWGNKHQQSQKFGKLSAGVEFVLETTEGEKAFLDFGHVAFNNTGYWILPTPTEIKLPRAAGQVSKQFSEFVPRLRRAKKLIVKFEKSDLTNLQKQVGYGIMKLEEMDGLIHAEIDHTKLVFDPLARNQIVVKPGFKEWGLVKHPNKSPNIDIGIGTTMKGKGFFFWKFEVDVSRSPFEKLYRAIILGTR
jgi:hypothetical protein